MVKTYSENGYMYDRQAPGTYSRLITGLLHIAQTTDGGCSNLMLFFLVSR